MGSNTIQLVDTSIHNLYVVVLSLWLEVPLVKTAFVGSLLGDIVPRAVD